MREYSISKTPSAELETAHWCYSECRGQVAKKEASRWDRSLGLCKASISSSFASPL